MKDLTVKKLLKGILLRHRKRCQDVEKGGTPFAKDVLQASALGIIDTDLEFLIKALEGPKVIR